MSNVAPALQPALVGVPEQEAPAPYAYIAPAACTAQLEARWGLTVPTLVTPGHVLAASMRCDQEGPWQGVKVLATQERDWPRTFKYGWPNIIAAPTPVLVALSYPGAWPLNYEQVIPLEIVDWTCLEVYRLLALPLLRQVERESVTGASVTYAPPGDAKNGLSSPIFEMMDALISPFLLRSARISAFERFSGL